MISQIQFRTDQINPAGADSCFEASPSRIWGSSNFASLLPLWETLFNIFSKWEESSLFDFDKEFEVSFSTGYVGLFLLSEQANIWNETKIRK